jgi:hypothetical protein
MQVFGCGNQTEAAFKGNAMPIIVDSPPLQLVKDRIVKRVLGWDYMSTVQDLWEGSSLTLAIITVKQVVSSTVGKFCIELMVEQCVATKLNGLMYKVLYSGGWP